MKLFLLLLFSSLIVYNGCDSRVAGNQKFSLLQKAEFYENNDKLDSAIIYYDKILDSIKTSSSDSLYNTYLLKIIDLKRKKGNFTSCSEQLENPSFSLLKGELLVRFLLLQGNLKFDMGNYSDAEKIFKNAYERIKITPVIRKDLLADCLDGYGRVELAVNKFSDAESLFQNSIAIKNEIYSKESPEIAATKINIGGLYSAKGDYNKALEMLNEQLKFLQKKSLLKGTLLNNLGIVYYRLSDFNKALENFKASLEIRLEYLKDSHPLVADVYNNFGLVYDSYGEPEMAIDYYTKALNNRIKNFGEKQRVIARNYNNLANACKDTRDYERALQYYNSALDILTEISPEDLDIGVVLINYAETFAILKKYPEAINNFFRAVKIQEKYFGKIHPWLAITYLNIGTAFSDFNKEKEGRIYLDKSYVIGRKVFTGRHQLFSQLFNEYGRIEEQKKNYKKALGWYQKSLENSIPTFKPNDIYSNPSPSQLENNNIVLETLSLKARALFNISGVNSDLPWKTYDIIGELIDKIRSGFKEESSRLLLSENVKEVIEDAINTYYIFYLKTGSASYTEKAFSFCERSKALLLLETVLDKKAQKFGGIPDSLLKREASLKNQLSILDKKVHDEGEEIASGDSLKFKQLQNSLIDLKQQHIALISYFEKNYPDYYKLKYNTRTVNLNDLFKKLNRSTFMAEYFIGKEQVYIFTFTGNKLDIIAVPCKKPVEEICTNFLKGLKELNYSLYAVSAFELYNIILAPLRKASEGKELVIIPDGILNYIPFEALITSKPDLRTTDYKKLHYLIYDYKMSYGYSAALLYENIYKKGNLKDASFIGFAPY